jgi:hypothetical protein
VGSGSVAQLLSREPGSPTEAFARLLRWATSSGAAIVPEFTTTDVLRVDIKATV